MRPMYKLGALAAFGTACFFSLSAIFFEHASRRIGALAVNFWKVCFAFVLLSFAGLVSRGMPIPIDATAKTWLFLSLSGIIGFVVSDYFLFNAYVLIGSRITVVFQALTPLFTAAFAFIFLGERMRSVSVIAMFVVVAGIFVVVWARNSGSRRRASPGSEENQDDALAGAASRKGYAFAFASALFQAAGLLFSKIGLADYSAISGTQIRVFTAIIGFGLMALLTGQSKTVFARMPKERKAFTNTAVGSIFGPFLGVTCSLFALQNTTAGTASTLMALTPVLIIPPSILLLKQRVAAMEVVGALVAVSGAALFFLL